MKFHTLIASDVDGTLIPEETTVLPQSIIEQISAAYDRGYLFMAASGRPYHSLRTMFAPVADKMAFSIVNGGAVYYHDELCCINDMPRELATAITADILSQPECDCLVDAVDGCTILPKTEAYRCHICDEMQYPARCVERLEDLPEQMMKIAAYCVDGASAVVDGFQRRWGEQVKVLQSGSNWIDFNLSDKGKGMLAACDVFGIPHERTIAFGDNWNDAPMLQCANQAFLMRSAKPELKALFPTLCDDVAEEMKKILKN